MSQASKFWEQAIGAAKRAVHLEAADNIQHVILKKTGQRDFLLLFGLHNSPNDDDLETLSLIETEMAADIWSWVGEINSEWDISRKSLEATEDSDTAIIYDKLKSQ